MPADNTNEKKEGLWLKVFCPDARCLSEEEILDLPAEKREVAEASGKKGLWLEVFCPDEACLMEGERMSLPVEKVPSGSEKGVWLNLFCPEDHCVLEEGSDLP
jgi:hypothetical protein